MAGRSKWSWFRMPLLLLAWAIALCWPGTLRAALQFDVFIGYDNIVREGNWFPVVCEVHNDGPSFNAIFELTADGGGRSQVREITFELPTNTRKRFVIPVFGSSGRFAGWNARLLDASGRVRGEHKGLRAKKDVSWETRLLGALPRNFNGMPTLPTVSGARADMQPEAARLQPEQFPDTPLGLEGLTAIYLNSEKALELKDPQINALRLWMHNGGHLILAVEQPADISGTPWLRQLVPCDVTGVSTVKEKGDLQSFVQRGPGRSTEEQEGRTRATKGKASQSYNELSADAAFEPAEMPVAMCTPRSDARVLVKAGGQPLILEAPRGRGKVTLLAFSPEREPFRSWRNRSWFWARLMDVPSTVFNSQQNRNYGATSLDGVFGSMLDSAQVRKLPVSWLLLLLLVYLVVIGPLDQYILKKLNRQMLTWITFPSYVVLFSLLIYWIGFMLRAGETEWNELHVVDLLPRGERVDMRGHSYGSVYSPSNARYRFASEQPYATLRGEFLGSWQGAGESSRSTVRHRGNGYEAEVSVPVWVSELFVSDWWQPAEAPIKASVVRKGGKLQLTVENLLPRTLASVRLAVDGRIHDVTNLQAKELRTVELDPVKGRALADYVREHGQNFQNAANSRRQSFGDDHGTRLRDAPNAASAASFIGLMADVNQNAPNNYYPNQFIAPDGFDLSGLVGRGEAVLLAWDAGNAPVKPLNRFDPRRTRRDTLYRLAMTVTD